VFDHVTIRASDGDASEQFYDQRFPPVSHLDARESLVHNRG
jgi:catechol 2,3-dioxygenase-like lactoylglutathione lyase family enzyme